MTYVVAMVIGTLTSRARLKTSKSMGKGDFQVASSDGGGRAAGRLSGGNLNSDRSGTVKCIEGPDMFEVVHARAGGQ